MFPEPPREKKKLKITPPSVNRDEKKNGEKVLKNAPLTLVYFGSWEGRRRRRGRVALFWILGREEEEEGQGSVCPGPPSVKREKMEVFFLIAP